MRRFKRLCTSALVVAACSRAMADTTYTIQRIGLTDPNNAPGLYVGVDSNSVNIETNNLYYADTSGAVVGATQQYNGTSSGTYNADWLYNGSTTFQLGLTAANGSQYVKPAAAGSAAGDVSTSVYSTGYNGTRVYNNGYVAGTSARYDTNNNSMGADAWLFNGSTNVRIPLPTLATGGSNATYAGSLSFSYVNPNTAAATYGDTIQAMGVSNIVMPGGNGSATGVATLYYANTSSSPTTYTAIGNGFSDYDAWYYNGTSTVQIGLISGDDVNSASTTGVTGTANTPFDRASVPIRISSNGLVFGYSKYYGGTTSLTSANGQDLWLYDPTNTNPSNSGTFGANGTMLVAPPSTTPGESYTGGNSNVVAPQFSNNNGQFAASFQLFYDGTNGTTADTARATALGQDGFVGTYSGGTVSWAQVGLTATVDPAYTFYPVTTGTASAKAAGVGGTYIGTTSGYLPQYPALNAGGQVVGYTKRTASNSGSPVTLGQDAWVYYPAGDVPSGASAGTTRLGLIGTNSSVYETNTGTGVTRSSAPIALSTNGGVAGYSTRYSTNTATTSAGQDAWYYDPAHGITSTIQVGLQTTASASNYQFTPASGNIYESSTITALNNTGMVGGTSVRFPTGTGSSANNGYDAWVFDSATDKTYNVDPNTAATPSSQTSFTYSTISFISDTGLALGYDYNSASNSSGSTTAYKLFEWHLTYDAGDGKNDTPDFQYLSAAVDPASFTAGNWSKLFNTLGYESSQTAAGNLIGLGQLSTEDSSSYVPFVLSPESVPEPGSLSVLAAGGLMLLLRRRRAVGRERASASAL